MNTAADNQTTHCIAVYGMRKAEHHNLSLAEAFCDDACKGGADFAGGVALGAASMAYNG
jgi:predicted Rossmann fold nucleotide-binding protein DprA/Smf involved in DNA uptake